MEEMKKGSNEVRGEWAREENHEGSHKGRHQARKENTKWANIHPYLSSSISIPPPTPLIKGRWGKYRKKGGRGYSITKYFTSSVDPVRLSR